MEPFDFSAIKDAIGIYNPWSIKSASIDNVNDQILVHIEAHKKEKKFLFFENKKPSDELVEGSWLYQPVGSFRLVVKAQTSPKLNDVHITDTIIGMPAFLGHPARNYSNYLRQQVALLQLKGLDNKLIASTLNIEEPMVEQIARDIYLCSSKVRSLAHLPTEIDPIWKRVLADQVRLRTSVLPLKLLLSKLKLAITGGGKKADYVELVSQLRNFFISNAHMVGKEIDQLCSIEDGKTPRSVQQNKTKLRLVLPSPRNPLWLDLLNGTLKLNSLSMPLNLLISRQRLAFLNGDNSDKVQAIENLRQYFRKNYRSLKSELLLINRAMDMGKKNEWNLPGPDSAIWQKILEDKEFISSDHVAYKLLLAKLRSQVSLDKDPVVKIEAATRIRKFLQQNQKSMRNELNTILLQQSKAV